VFADAAVELGGPVVGGGVLGTLVVYLLVYDRPKMQKEFSASLAGIVRHQVEMDYILLLYSISADPKNDPVLKAAIRSMAERAGITKDGGSA